MNNNNSNDYKSLLEKLISTLSTALPDIERDILIEIAGYAMGKIIVCNNDWCNNEVFISNQHKCDGIPNRPLPAKKSMMVNGEIFEYYPTPNKRDAIPDKTYNDTDFDLKYWYDPDKDIAYCYQCRSIMRLCGGKIICTGYIFDIDTDKIKTDKAFQLCACTRKSRMCFIHSKCKQCGFCSCAGYDGNAGNGYNGDNCEERNCSTCETSGCIQCIPIISCEGVLKSLPPQFVNPVYKCRNGCSSGKK